MAYSTDAPPALVSQRVGANGLALWLYNSEDAATVVRVTGYITNGDDLGMKVGDIVIQGNTVDGDLAHIYTDGTAVVATDTD